MIICLVAGLMIFYLLRFAVVWVGAYAPLGVILTVVILMLYGRENWPGTKSGGRGENWPGIGENWE